MPGNDSDEYAFRSAAFLRQFTDLAARLSDIGVTTVDANLRFGFMGSWTMTFRKRFEEIRVSFEPRDEFIDIEYSPVDQHTSYRNWTTAVQRPCPTESAVSQAEAFIRARYPLAPKPPGAH